MPLRAILNSQDVHSFRMNGHEWQQLKDSYKQESLLMPCCNGKAIPKTSVLGNFFFAHHANKECKHAGESEQHLILKTIIAEAAINAGWDTKTEVDGATPNGEEWRADVYCTKGNVKIAFEVQLTRISNQIIKSRQYKYKQSDVRAAWFGASKKYKKHNVGLTEEIPFFQISEIEQTSPKVNDFDIPLENFVQLLLQGKVKFKEQAHDLDSQVKFDVIYFDDICHNCNQEIKQIFGYLSGGEKTPATKLELFNFLNHIKELVGNISLEQAGLNSINQGVNICFYCGASQSNESVMLKSEEKGSILKEQVAYKGCEKKYKWEVEQ